MHSSLVLCSVPSPAGCWRLPPARPGVQRRSLDIWRIDRDSSGAWSTPERLPERMIFMADGGLYETRKTVTGWALRTKLGPEVNQNGSEIGPLFSPSGRSLLFARDTQGSESGEFFVWYEHGSEAGPPDCPARQPP